MEVPQLWIKLVPPYMCEKSYNDQDRIMIRMILDSKMYFASHIQVATSKCGAGIGMIKFLSTYLPRKTLGEPYKSYLRRHLEHGYVIYQVPRSKCELSHTLFLTRNMEKLEQIQYSAVLAITGAWKGISREKLYDELG